MEMLSRLPPLHQFMLTQTEPCIQFLADIELAQQPRIPLCAEFCDQHSQITFEGFQDFLEKEALNLPLSVAENLFWAFGASVRDSIPLTRQKLVMGMEVMFRDAAELAQKYPERVDLINSIRPLYIFAYFNAQMDNVMSADEFVKFVESVLPFKSISESDVPQLLSSLRYGGCSISLVVFCHYASGPFQAGGIPLELFKVLPGSISLQCPQPVNLWTATSDSNSIPDGQEQVYTSARSAVLAKLLQPVKIEETSAEFTLILPPAEEIDPQILHMLYTDILDLPRLDLLQSCGAINSQSRMSQCLERRNETITLTNLEGVFSALLPLRVKEDGNCLLHAASVAMWEVDDAPATVHDVGPLREAIRRMVCDPACSDQFHAAWRKQKSRWDALLPFQVEKTEAQWADEWSKELEWAHTDRSWLSELHVFILAHVIKRPIVLYADANQSDSRCYFGGVYLPRFWPPAVCERVPIALGYEASHFFPLVCHLRPSAAAAGGEAGGAARRWPLIPLEAGGRALELVFCVGDRRRHRQLLCEYMNVEFGRVVAGCEVLGVSLELAWRSGRPPDGDLDASRRVRSYVLRQRAAMKLEQEWEDYELARLLQAQEQ